MSNKHRHLTLDERRIIENGIRNGSDKTSIANTLGKDNSTIGKEIKQHRVCTYKCKLALECSNYKKCEHGRDCHVDCPDYVPFKCGRRDRSPGACNGCPLFQRCRFSKFVYKPETANDDYRNLLITSRSGINATVSEIKALGERLKPLLDQGQSIYHILINNPDIELSERTLYSYIEDGVFKDVGVDITNMSLRRKVGRKLSKVKSRGFKKRVDSAYLKGRKYSDLEAFIEDNPDVSIVEMDTVYNNPIEGPFIQTFKFLKYGLLFAILHATKTQKSMNHGVEVFEKVLGEALFKKVVVVLKTDRGTEFSDPSSIEMAKDGSRRTRVYYCDPMASHQKGSIENIHIELRTILPKGVDLRALGLKSQKDLNKVLSHINSYSKENLDHKSSFQVLEFFNHEMHERLMEFGLEVIPPESIILKPYLLKM